MTQHRLRARIAVLAAVAALTGSVALAAPANASAVQLVRMERGSVMVDGQVVAAIRFATKEALTSGDSQSDLSIIVDERGGMKYRGVTVNNNWTARWQRTGCYLTGPDGSLYTNVFTSDYRIGARGIKRWDWPREWRPNVQREFWELYNYYGQIEFATCVLDVR